MSDLLLKTPPLFAILGANTGVGKTLVSLGLCAKSHEKGWQAVYIKPLQTGFPTDSDERLISEKTPHTKATTLYKWKNPLSPHLCVEREGGPVTDDTIRKAILNEVAPFVGLTNHLCLLEGAGGVLSPAASGTPQADLYRPLFPAIVLVGDSTLGGISTTLTAWESLRARGYAIPTLVLARGDLENHHAIARLVAPHTQVVTLPPLPSGALGTLDPWLREAHGDFEGVWQSLMDFKTSQGADAPWVHRALEQVWYPFYQHKGAHTPLVVHHTSGASYGFLEQEAFLQVHNGSGSWWTQGLPYGDAPSTQSWCHATARYGHILFPGHIHQPAAHLSQLLLKGVGKGWARRVFFSDNGSTGVEVALKMAFGLCKARGLEKGHKRRPKVLGIADSYHGDTLGAMNACSPGPFNDNEPWYTPEGHWLEAPVWSLQKGVWHCNNPVKGALPQHFDSVKSIFLSPPMALNQLVYQNAITQFVEQQGGWHQFGAVVIEPLIHGAGGMVFIDPLFQRTLAALAKSNGVPVVCDEVFTGFWRVEKETGFEKVGIQPDIAVFSKRLTGGTTPLACTLATEETFQAFLGDGTLQALLHGHSYTAQPGACAVASHALERYRNSPFLEGETMAPLWPQPLLNDLSHLPQVAGVVAIGQILAIHCRMSEKGYKAQMPPAVIRRLQEKGLHTRSLGSTLYALTTPFCDAERHRGICQAFLEVLREGV